MSEKTNFVSSSSSSSSHSTPPPPPPDTWNYDVFLSFRGQDTRKNFTDHLYDALIRVGIRTFRDDDELSRGKQISFELLKAIEESRISIIVFSVNYASSRWCLDELVKIIDCKNTIHQLVLPVFHGIDPSDVRKQTGSFAQAFERHEQRFWDEMEKVDKWRAALIEAGNLSGWHLGNGHESKFIKKIVEEVQRHVNQKYLNVAKHPVGIAGRVQNIESLLSIRLNDIRIVGLYGLGGIGKSTIAKAVYNQCFQLFEGSCFIANVREVSEQPNGLVHIQGQILSEILKEKNFKVDNVDRGMVLMKKRLHSKRVLIILDDLDNLSQVNALVGQNDWFGPGSRIIITTRDEHLLIQAEVHWRYEASKLNDDESLELFCLHAFKTTTPSDDYLELSKGIVAYAGGLPLALEVLGGYLIGRTREQWESAFKKLQQIPHDQILEKLKISFDGLDDDVKEIFLDIACFFVGMDNNLARIILNGCGFHSEIGINVLKDRCLLRLRDDGMLVMHNLVRDMGRAIVHKESPKSSEKRSRLWFHEDGSHVLENDKGTKAIEGLSLVLPTSKEIHISSRSFQRINKLRLLEMNNVHVTGSLEHLSKQLRWLCWHHCPLKCLASISHMEKLVVLDMQHSKINTIWKGTEFLKSLKILNLGHSNLLTGSVDFKGVPMLEALLLEGCTSLLEVHSSIGTLVRLAHLNLKDCKELRNLPYSICILKSLGYLNLTGCSNLESLPENLGLLKNLTSLYLDGCNNSEPVNSWFSFIPSLFSSRRTPSCTRFLPASISCLKSLTKLSLKNCNMSDGDIPVEIGSLSSLKKLDLGSNIFCFLPDSLSLLSKLHWLAVNNCPCLQSLPKLPPNIETIYMNNCTSMERLPDLSKSKKSVDFYLRNCSRFAASHGMGNFVYTSSLRIDCRSNLVKNFMDSFSQLHTERVDLPERIYDQKKTCSISFDIPPTIEKKHYFRLKILVVYEAKKDGCVLTRICRVRNLHKASERVCFSQFKSQTSGNYFLLSRITRRSLERIEVEFEIAPSACIVVKMCRVDLIQATNRVVTLHGHKIGFDVVETSSGGLANKDSKRLRVEEEDEDLYSKRWRRRMVDNKTDTEYIHLFYDGLVNRLIVEEKTFQSDPLSQLRYFHFLR